MKILLSMLFLHLIDDYVLQGILAKLKQKDWWKENVPQEMYKYDYMVALIEHAFMNSFMIHIPIYIWLCQDEFTLFGTICVSTYLHAKVDNDKANKKKIPLLADQVLHILWIGILFAGYRFFRG